MLEFTAVSLERLSEDGLPSGTVTLCRDVPTQNVLTQWTRDDPVDLAALEVQLMRRLCGGTALPFISTITSKKRFSL